MKTEKLINHLRAGFSLFCIQTHEPNRVREKVYSDIKAFQRKDGNTYDILEWDCTSKENPINIVAQLIDSQQDGPLKILFLYNLHWFLDKPQLVQAIQNAVPILSSRGHAIIIVSPVKKIPIELEKDIVMLKMGLPNKEEIKQMVELVAPDEKRLPKDKEMGKIVNHCLSLTQAELKQTLALSLIETEGERFDIKVIDEYRAQSINKTGFLEVLKGDIKFADVIGYDQFKYFVLETHEHKEAKGVMTIGAPGCGKTSIMKAIVGETGKFGLQVNMGKLFSKYQGETDQNINTVIEIICSVGNCFVLFDEFEKQFSGAASDGSLDSGTTRRATGAWLDFLQNRPEGVYVCGTANSFRGIPPEYLRPGRWDTSPFHIDLPGEKTRKAILDYYLDKKGMIKKEKKLPDIENFTGSEIEALVHIAYMRKLSLNEARKSIIPQINWMGEEIKTMREWAKERCISAEEIVPANVAKKNNLKLDL